MTPCSNNDVTYAIHIHNVSSIEFLDRELKHLDIARFLPIHGLTGACIRDLCQEIFEHGIKVNHDLRRGVWLHLLGVFHPDLTSREEREQYMRKLRMVYDNLKGIYDDTVMY